MMQLAGPARASLARFPSPVERDLLGARRALFNPNADPGTCFLRESALGIRCRSTTRRALGAARRNRTDRPVSGGVPPGKIGKYTDSPVRTFTDSVARTGTDPARSLAVADMLSCVALRENQANEIGDA
jgi:hypothetical protein